jgi:hypothetical protein
MANYKNIALVDELVSRFQIHLGVPCVKTFVTSGTYAGEAAITFGSAVASGGGGTILLLDQRGDLDAGFKDLPGFSGSTVQPVYTSGVASVIVESTGAIGTAAVKASGTATLVNTLTDTITIGATTLTAGTDFVVTGTDAQDAAALAAAINAHATLRNQVFAAVDVTVTNRVNITALVAGPSGNLIALSETGTTITVSGAALSGGVGAINGSFVTPIDTVMKIVGRLGSAGQKVNLYAVAAGNAPVATGTLTLVAEFNPNIYFPISGLV